MVTTDRSTASNYGNDLTSVLAVRALLGMPMVLELFGRLGRRQTLSHDRPKR